MNAPVLNPSRRAFLRRLMPATRTPGARPAAPEASYEVRPAATVAHFERSGTPPKLTPSGSTPFSAPSAAPLAAPLLAVIAGRFCLAYRHSFCSVCRERCPVPGAVVVERGLPRIDPTLCNGCRICHEVCPAPVNAIRLVPRPAGADANPPAALRTVTLP
jgi:ferredoxin